MFIIITKTKQQKKFFVSHKQNFPINILMDTAVKIKWTSYLITDEQQQNEKEKKKMRQRKRNEDKH